LKIEDKVLVHNIDINFEGSKHIVIIGKNGTGKTTLMKKLYELLKNRQDIKLGYMPQNYDDILNQYKTPLDFLCVTGEKDEISLVRSYMGNMNFTRDEMISDIKNLSGGSKAKLFLLKLILTKCDVLLLDEPTRNVSPLSNPVIRKVLRAFGGPIISISHDRKYIDEVCDDVYELTEWGLTKIQQIR
jgi:ATPase subunit of ABC transporter with duplicated ATPase domains